MTPNFSAYPFERVRRVSRREAALQSTVAKWLAVRSSEPERLVALVRRAGGGGDVAVVGRGGGSGDATVVGRGGGGGDAMVVGRGGGGDVAVVGRASDPALVGRAGGGDVAARAAATRVVRPSKRVAETRRATHDVRIALAAQAARFDPFAARCHVRARGAVFEVRGASAGVRAIAQRILGGPEELAAPRPLTVVERSIWAFVVATALEDFGVPGDVSPVLEEPRRSVGRADNVVGRADAASPSDNVIELAVDLVDISIAVQIVVPVGLELGVPPPRAPAFELPFDVPIIVGRCALPRMALDRLAPRSLVTLEACCELEILGGTVGLRAAPGEVEARVTTGYVRRDMSLPDDAHVELTVTLGTTRLSLRQVCDLAIGQIVQLGRPLAGPFEIRAEGRLVGRGELVDVDGELAVRIVSLGDQE